MHVCVCIYIYMLTRVRAHVRACVCVCKYYNNINYFRLQVVYFKSFIHISRDDYLALLISYKY